MGAVLAVVLGGLFAVRAITDDQPERLVAEAAAALAAENEVAYRGTVLDEHGLRTSVHIGAAADGRMVADLSRHLGGTAQLLSRGATTAVRGDADWWTWSRPGLAEQLAGRWFSGPPHDAVGGLDPDLLTPRALADALTASGGQWQRTGERQVGGVAGIELWDGNRFVVVTATAPHRLLTVDLPHTRQQVVPRAFTQDDPEDDEPQTVPVPAVHLDIEPPEGQIRDGLMALLDPKWDQRLVEEGLDVLDPSKDPQVGPDGRYGSRVQAVLSALQEPASLPGADKMEFPQAVETVRAFIGKGAFRYLERLALPRDGDGRIVNKGSGLAEFTHVINGVGQIEFLDLAVMPRFQAGHALFIEGSYAGSHGDLVDAGTVQQFLDREAGRTVPSPVEAIQHKHVIGRNPNETVAKAARQLNGEHGEPVADGARAVMSLSFSRGAAGVGVRADGSRFDVPLGQVDDTKLLQQMLKDVNIYKDMWRDGRLMPDVVLVQVDVDPDPETGERTLHVYDPEHLNPGNGGTGDAAAPVPRPDTPDGGSVPGGGPAAPGPSSLFAGQEKSVEARGALRDAAARPLTGTPGGIDFSSLELRYLAERDTDDGRSMRYAFAGRPGTGAPAAGSGNNAAQQASDAFFVWLALPPSAFTVNLNPDEPDRILDPAFGRTDAGRILLEADLQMKKTVAGLIHPDSPRGAEFWNALGGGDQSCLSLRQWIVPAPAQIRANGDELYILDAPLQVKMETEYLTAVGVGGGSGCPQQSKAVEQQNETVFRTMILPEIERAVNEAPEYADLRQVYLSRVAAEWYRQRSRTESLSFTPIIDRGDVTAWPARVAWSPREVFDRYVDSYKNGEFNVTRETRSGDFVLTHTYVYGGVDWTQIPFEQLSPDELQSRWPGSSTVLDDSFTGPAHDQQGRVWLSSTSTVPSPPGRSGLSLSMYLAIIVIAIGVGFVLRSWWQVRRTRTAWSAGGRSLAGPRAPGGTSPPMPPTWRS